MARKNNRTRDAERDSVLGVLRNSESSLTHDQVRDQYAIQTGQAIAYTTLRKRLDELLTANLVERTPDRRNPRYTIRHSAPDGSAATPEHETTSHAAGSGRTAAVVPETAAPAVGPGSQVPLSTEGARARVAMLRPRALRTPVTYNDAFLDAYTPGQTWYLPLALRTHLADLGRTTYAGQPAGTYARDIMQRLIIDLSWGSSRLEGNKFTRIDTEVLLAGGNEVAGASPRDRQMILNHKAAIEFLVENAQDINFNRYTILGLHALLAENLLGNAEDEGTLRIRPITIGDSVYTPTAIPQVIEQQFALALNTAQAIPDPMEQAFFIMVHLPYLQPFIDVNKRTSRLGANIPLIKNNLCPLSFVDVPEDLYTEGTLAVYELNDVALLRDVFAWAYQRSCTQFNVLRQSMGEPDPIRLRYRTELRAVVASTVREGRWPTDADLLMLAEQYAVPALEQPAFIAAARRDLVGLRVDILARYQLRISEFAAWIRAVGERR